MKIIFFGDSITEAAVFHPGYIVQIRRRLDQTGAVPAIELIGAGIGGNTVYDLYLRCERDVVARQPDLVVVFIGVNDVWHQYTRGAGTRADQFEQYYRAIIGQISAGGARMILCTPMGIGEARANPYDATLDHYADIIRQLAARYRLPLCDLREKFQAFLAPFDDEQRIKGMLTTDGVHLNDRGNQLVAKALLECLGY